MVHWVLFQWQPCGASCGLHVIFSTKSLDKMTVSCGWSDVTSLCCWNYHLALKRWHEKRARSSSRASTKPSNELPFFSVCILVEVALMGAFSHLQQFAGQHRMPSSSKAGRRWSLSWLTPQLWHSRSRLTFLYSAPGSLWGTGSFWMPG